ncbi:predicted protein [Postia placenta Mad-698-R]|uniref:Retrotransposon gag domain-containing protein n=1 Tax=Postia placenta MAD-698-R-SB12 TaxID=670580 RepID=A0A1X6MJF1_9APHY|nr:hypothetical protein POSPLADRAFT_1159189 [Postia placenta MAD-698-R-SB12]EED78705.1 predicted protein [Postia placenta Mad-698-R]OSX56571.1 hypothetical protein POSPLADRAFT_1159189 [Postia placenta MAD-698-R-SB12]
MSNPREDPNVPRQGPSSPDELMRTPNRSPQWPQSRRSPPRLAQPQPSYPQVPVNPRPAPPVPPPNALAITLSQIATLLQNQQQGGGRKPVVNKPKDFDGNKDEYEKWKMEMRLFLADHQITDDNRRTNIIVSYIRGPKVDAFIRILYNTNCPGGYWQISSAELWGILDDHYVDASLREKAQQKIEYVCQGNRSADDYIVEFEDLASQAGYNLGDEHVNGAPVSAALTATGEFARRKKLCGAATTATQTLLGASQQHNRLVKLLQQHHKELLGSYQWPGSHTSRGGMERVLCTKEVGSRCRSIRPASNAERRRQKRGHAETRGICQTGRQGLGHNEYVSWLSKRG